MLAPFPALNSDDRGFDRRYLAAGEVSGNGEGTNMFPHITTHRLEVLARPNTVRFELDAGHGGHDGAAVLRRRNKASSS